MILRGTVHDQFIGLTEGVIAHEELEDPIEAVSASHEGGGRWRLLMSDGTSASLGIEPLGDDGVLLSLAADLGCLRLAFAWAGHPEARYTGLGARHGVHVDQAGRSVQLGADRRYTGPDCPPVAPVLENGVVEREVDLPRGSGSIGGRARPFRAAARWWPRRRWRASRCGCGGGRSS